MVLKISLLVFIVIHFFALTLFRCLGFPVMIVFNPKSPNLILLRNDRGLKKRRLTAPLSLRNSLFL